MMSINLIDIAIQNISGADYHYIVHGIAKSETIKLHGKCRLNWKM